MQGRYRQIWIFSTVLTAVLLGFYAPWLFGQRDFFLKDTATFFEPLCRVIGEGLRQGRLPLWNPYSYCGMSEAAISSPSVFYPPNWLFALLPFSSALAFILLLSQLICAIGMYLLIASLGWGIIPAIIGAAAAGLSGFMFSFSSNYTIPATAAWFPLLLYLTRRCFVPPASEPGALPATGQAATWIALAVVVGLLVSAGRPEIAGPALLLCLALAAVLFAKTQADRRESTIGFVRALFIGALFAMPTILPSLEWIPVSRRSQGLPAAEILMYSANWYDLLCMAIPLPLGDLQLRGSPFAPLVVPGSYIPYYGSAFVGTVVLLFATIGLSKRGGALYWSTIALLLSTTVLALGSNVPGMDALIVYVPGASLIRFPSKLLFFAVFALAMLAARGAKLYLNRQVSLIPSVVTWGIAICAALLIYLQKQNLFLPFLYVANRYDALLAQLVIALRGMLHFAVAFAGAGLLLILGRREKRLLAAGILATAEIGALLFNAFANCTAGAPPQFYNQPSFILGAIKTTGGVDPSARLTALYPERFTIPPSQQAADRLADTIKDFQYGRAMLRPFCNADYHVPSAFGFEGAMVGEYYYYFLNLYVASSQASAAEGTANKSDVPLYRLLQCGASSHVITQMVRLIYSPHGTLGSEVVPPLDPTYFDRVWADPQLNAQIYKLKQPLPRAYLSGNRHVFASRDDLINYMANAEKTGFDPARETLLESSSETQQTAGFFVPLKVVEHSPEQLEIHTEVDKPALLVLQDQYYPGWQATVDGKATEILRCNGFMRALEISAGKHEVVFLYQPATVYGGLMLCGVAALWCILLFARRKTAVTKGDSNVQG